MKKIGHSFDSSIVGIPLFDDQLFVDTLHLPIAFEGLGCVGNESSLGDCAQDTSCFDCIRNTDYSYGCSSAGESVAVSCEGKLLVSVTNLAQDSTQHV